MVKKWIIAMRLWTLTASIIPVMLGATIAWYQLRNFHTELFFLTLLGGIILQACSNLLNTYGDYVSGIDTAESKQITLDLLEGDIPPKTMKNVAIGMIIVAACIGIFLFLHAGWLILVFGILGILGTLGYTTGKFPYKYYALGTILVFFLMGPFMVLPAYIIQGGELNLNAVLFSLPVSFLVALILFGNEIRDLDTDKKGGIKTLAILFGKEKALKVYKYIIYLAYCSLILLMALRLLPITGFLPFLLIPMIDKQLNQLYLPLEENVRLGLVKFGAKIHFLFGILMTLGLIMGGFINSYK